MKNYYKMYLLTNIINMLCNQHFPFTYILKTQTCMHNSISHGSNTLIKMVSNSSLQSLRCSSFIVLEDIISILVDKNFTMNATGMMLESL